MMVIALIDEARQAGARQRPCCDVLGIDPRTIQRWRAKDIGDDMRMGPKTEPGNKLSAAERAEVLAVAASPEYRDKSPKQIVPDLADKGRYVASEATFYRVLREEDQLAHRGRQKPRTSKPPQEQRATGPGQVLSWDITYLRAPVAGMFFFLYLYIDVWSRKIIGFRVDDRECGELAAELLRDVCRSEGLDEGVVVHQDNGGPMKGATLKTTMERLGVIPSFSRPRVSDDNPFSEAAFRTLKYHPSYPHGPFEGIEAARAWVHAFVAWYNHEHLHSGIGFVTPADRHAGQSDAILDRRKAVYEAARRRNPQRWSGDTRAWKAPAEVILNPTKASALETKESAVAA
jgi:transposase InsO family protein